MAGSELLVLNPRRRRRGRRAKAASSRTRRRRRRVHAVARHNPRRHVRRRRAHARVGRRRVRRNPRIGGAVGNNTGTILGIGVGMIATELLAAKLADMLPAAWNTNPDLTRIGTKAAIGIGVPLLAGKMLPRGWGKWLAIGGGVAVLHDLFVTFVAPKIPGVKLSGYEIGPSSDGGFATIASGMSGFDQSDSPMTLAGGIYDNGVYGNNG